MTPLDDTLVEGKEYAYLNLSGNSAYQTGSASASYIYIWDDERPEVKWTATDASASESGPDGGRFTVSCFPAPKAPLTVRFALSGTASNGVDYAALSGTVQIPAGQLSVPITVNPVNDTVSEGTETVGATLVTDAAYQVGSPSGGTVYLYDNE